MSDIKVTQEQIDSLMNNAKVVVKTEFGKCTTVSMQLKNGFILTESSACVDPENYDPEMGKRICFEHIENRLWALEGYALQKRVHDNVLPMESGSFGWAIECVKHGHRVRRLEWYGAEQYIELAMGLCYTNASGEFVNAYQESAGNRAISFVGASGIHVGWQATPADMLADDWELADTPADD